jgi:shikimate dehydrogenase
VSSTNYKSELVGVFGHPVAENPTIVMQEAGFKALGLNWRYLNIEVLPQDLERAVQGLRAMNFAGINCTIPHKVAVLEFLDEVAPDAKLMGAVNTIRREGNKLIGENTDGKGFIRALTEDAKLEVAGKRVVVLGAGGAARAMTVELALNGATHITVVNRDQARGEALVKLLNENTPVKAEFVHWTEAYVVPEDTDILANATSIGLYPNVKDRPNLEYNSIKPNMIVCDVIPNPPHTPFLQAAETRGAKTLDGLGILVYQGAIAFKMWTGFEPDVRVMREALENVFQPGA